ncbi:MAG: thioredoxin domain-containing protein, partial [Candidatus Omnitrophota bacterium]|nr:thioredoxin domain-containing protein [Candidatus Omnitrophota bacterium]
IYLELKYFPLENMHPHAKLSAQYAECAARQGKFWPFHDLVIERQPQWKRLIDAKPAFEIMAVEADLDLYKLKFCLEDEKITAFIDQDKEEGRQKGVRSTPTYFINGKMVVGATALEEELTLLVGG